MSITNVHFVHDCTEISQDIIKCTNCSAKFKMSKAKKQSMAKLHNNGEMHKLQCFIIFFLHCSTSNYPVRQLKNILSMDNIKVKINSSNIVTAVNDN